MDNWIKKAGIGFFILSLATIIYEILLVRILSVLMFYSFVSLTVSLALFGISIGAILVYYMQDKLSENNIHKLYFIFAVTLITPFFILIFIELSPVYFANIISIFHPPQYQPFQTKFYSAGLPFITYLFITLFLLLITIPFILSGIISSILMFLYNNKISKIYFFDLIGASFGSLLVIPLLNYLGAPSSILLNSGIAFSGVYFISETKYLKFSRKWNYLFVLIMIFITFISYSMQYPKIKFVRGYYEPKIVHSEWNAFSRVVVHSGFIQMFPNRISKNYRGKIPRQLGMAINDTGYTIMVNKKGNLNVDYVKYLINSLVYYLNNNKDILIIGPGGGEDIIGANSFYPESITAVELNPSIVKIVNERFKEFTGAPYKMKNVKTVIENARSYIRYSNEKYDIISASLVYEWFEPTAGVFSLSESNLYTLEGFVDYFSHLKPDGIFNLCRFTDKRALRFTAMAMEAMVKTGIKDPKKNIFIASSYGLGAFLFKNSPFTEEELKTLKMQTRKLDFKIQYSPDLEIENKFYTLITTKNLAEYYKKNELDFSPVTDDRPFFNFLVKPSTFFSKDFWFNSSDFQSHAAFILNEVFIITIIMLALLFGIPFIFKRKDNENKITLIEKILTLKYFALIGLGFMMIEISLMRKLNIILSHPTLSISLVLFSMLTAGGLGSYYTGGIKQEDSAKSHKIMLSILITILFFYIIFIDRLLLMINDQSIFVRAIKGIIIIFPLGFFMGMPFPMGIKVLKDKKFIPWIWSVNGASSVLGAISAFIMALNFGFNFNLIIALGVYMTALVLIIINEKLNKANFFID